MSISFGVQNLATRFVDIVPNTKVATRSFQVINERCHKT